MISIPYILEKVGMGVCIGYTMICWIADLGPIGNMPPGVRFNLLFPAGMATTAIGVVASGFAYRHHRTMAKITLAACGLWAMWFFLPRL